MKTEFLKNLGLDDEVIKQIQAESGKDVTGAKATLQTQIETLTNQVTELQGQVAKRDEDLTGLKTQLEQAGQSSAKLAEVQKNLETLQGKYTQETEDYKQKLEQQRYEFSAREAANGIKFSCNAAKKEFINNLMTEKLPIKDGSLLGFDMFLAKQKELDPAAFMNEDTEKKDKPNFAPAPTPNQPQEKEPENPFGFNFMGVRKKE